METRGPEPARSKPTSAHLAPDAIVSHLERLPGRLNLAGPDLERSGRRRRGPRETFP